MSAVRKTVLLLAALACAAALWPLPAGAQTTPSGVTVDQRPHQWRNLGDPEIVCVNDGSTAICQVDVAGEYRARYRIRNTNSSGGDCQLGKRGKEGHQVTVTHSENLGAGHGTPKTETVCVPYGRSRLLKFGWESGTRTDYDWDLFAWYMRDTPVHLNEDAYRSCARKLGDLWCMLTVPEADSWTVNGDSAAVVPKGWLRMCIYAYGDAAIRRYSTRSICA